MTAHIHAENMRLYAQDAAETDKPWERWECCNVYREGWLELCAHPDWTAANYRRKPRTHTVNGFEVPEPMREALGVGATYFRAAPENTDFYVQPRWNHDVFDLAWLARGLVHATKEAAIANAKAMIGVAP